MRIYGMTLLSAMVLASLAQAASMTTPWGDRVTAENAWMFRFCRIAV